MGCHTLKIFTLVEELLNLHSAVVEKLRWGQDNGEM